MKDSFIYGLRDPNTQEIRYIGQSCQGLRRPKAHFLKSSLKKKTHRNSWLISLDGKVPEIIILEYCKIEDLNEREVCWISEALSLGWNLTNHTGGGGGIRGYRHTEETKQKIKAASIKMWKDHPIKLTDEARYRCGNSQRGKTVSIDKRNRLASRHGTFPFKVYLNLNYTYLGTFLNISECSRVLKICRKVIGRSLKTGIQKSGKYTFERLA